VYGEANGNGSTSRTWVGVRGVATNYSGTNTNAYGGWFSISAQSTIAGYGVLSNLAYASTKNTTNDFYYEAQNNGTSVWSVRGLGYMSVGHAAAPTALIHIGVGTASANTSPLKFTSQAIGAVLTVAEAGAVEFSVDNYFLTSTTSTIRKTIRDLVVRNITALRTLDGSDECINVTSGTFAVTLPTAVDYTKQYIIKNSGTGITTLNTTSSQTIDGNASGVLTLNQYDSITLRSDGANWFIV
jgi:hypothetical protein